VVAQALLDIFTIGSASAATMHRLKPLFLAITLLLLVDRFRRKGVTRDNLLHVALTCALLAVPRILDVVKKPHPVVAHTGSCH
jgi:hypothetical protein